MYTQPTQNILSVMTSDEFDRHAIIPPDGFDSIDNDKKFTRVVVDSMFRDTTQYPNPNDYYFVFDDDINDVASAKLLSIEIPLSTYLINMHFNTLWLSVNNGSEAAVTLTQGNYNMSDLVSMIETRLNAANLGATFTVSYNTSLDKVTFAASAPFSLNFAGKTNSLDPLLGFRKQNYASIANSITAPYRCNLEFNNYIVMCIEKFDNNKSNSKPLNKSFAVIPKNYNTMNYSDDGNITKNFNPPMARLAKIHISFFDKYGNAYDFQNMDHRFEILFHSFKQTRKYQGIFGKKK